MANPAAIAGIAAPVILEILKFARDMRELYGDKVTDEQIAEAWSRSSVRFATAAEAWRDAPSSSG